MFDEFLDRELRRLEKVFEGQRVGVIEGQKQGHVEHADRHKVRLLQVGQLQLSCNTAVSRPRFHKNLDNKIPLLFHDNLRCFSLL